MIKFSRQRESILNNLQGRCDHPTADMIYESVRVEQPNISLGTVYRNLAFLSENGQILKLSTGIGPDHYDGCTKPHNHFVCRCCGKVVDLDFIPKEDFIEKASDKFDGVIEGYSLQFLGKCGDCLSM
ncbi:MAG: transcriptional repressor [Wujia sp.]